MMSMNAQAYDQYKRTTVETVAPEKLLLMLYDGALRNIKSARKGIEDKDINKAHQDIVKVEEIILELMSTLNMEFEISNSLLALYEYMYRQLVQANVKKDPLLLNEVEEYLTELRDTWAEAARIIKQGSVMPGKEGEQTMIEQPVSKASMAQNSMPRKSTINLQG